MNSTLWSLIAILIGGLAAPTHYELVDQEPHNGTYNPDCYCRLEHGGHRQLLARTVCSVHRPEPFPLPMPRPTPSGTHLPSSRRFPRILISEIEPRAVRCEHEGEAPSGWVAIQALVSVVTCAAWLSRNSLISRVGEERLTRQVADSVRPISRSARCGRMADPKSLPSIRSVIATQASRS